MEAAIVMNDAGPTRSRRLGIILGTLTLTIGPFGMTGCAEVAEAGHAPGPEPAVLEEIGDELHTITLTAKAVERLGLETVEVEDGADGPVVPYAALIYDRHGDTWVYTSPESRVFVRAAVAVDRIEGDDVHLSDGPAPGTLVVTLGAAELFGAEFNTAH
jgi:hypothetical protein